MHAVRYFIMNKAQSAKPKKRIVFAEGEETKIIRAAAQVQDEGIGIPILIGRPEVIQQKIKELALDLDCEIVDPNNFDQYRRIRESLPRTARPQGHDPCRRPASVCANRMCSAR